MDIRYRVHQLALINPFGISRDVRTHNNVMLVRIDEGWGESSPIKFYGEDMDTVAAALEKFKALDIPDPDCVEDISDALNSALPGNMAAKAAVDIALHDRLARRLGVPLYKLFGRSPAKQMMSSFTIGIDTIDEMLRKVDDAREYAVLKIKLGKELGHDLEVMKLIRQAVGRKTLRVDANGGWTLDEARQALPVMADLGVEYVEQPLYKGKIDDLRALKKDSPVPIFVDEDSLVNADLPGLVGAVDGINIKLMKSGGLVEARRMIATARAFDFQVMIGCMIESSVGIAAAAHLGPHCDYLDLDGNLLINNDPFFGLPCDAKGQISLPNAPGLGITLNPGETELAAL